jgi:hypothetical protein
MVSFHTVNGSLDGLCVVRYAIALGSKVLDVSKHGVGRIVEKGRYPGVMDSFHPKRSAMAGPKALIQAFGVMARGECVPNGIISVSWEI